VPFNLAQDFKKTTGRAHSASGVNKQIPLAYGTLIAASEGPEKYDPTGRSGTRAMAEFVKYRSYTIDNTSKFRSKKITTDHVV
jgi:hypothetical protein